MSALLRVVVLFFTLAGVLGVSNAHASASDAALTIAAPGAIHAAKDAQCDAWLAKQPSVREARASRPAMLDLTSFAATLPRAERAEPTHARPQAPRPEEPVFVLSPARARAWLMVFHI